MNVEEMAVEGVQRGQVQVRELGVVAVLAEREARVAAPAGPTGTEPAVHIVAGDLGRLTLDDEAALRSAAAIEDATFAAYASDYVEAMTRPGCKGCHGG